jgi:bacteriocin-like protein
MESLKDKKFQGLSEHEMSKISGGKFWGADGPMYSTHDSSSGNCTTYVRHWAFWINYDTSFSSDSGDE